MIPFESSLERDWIIALDSDPAVVSICSQPFTVEYYNSEGDRRYYTPDLLATFQLDRMEGGHPEFMEYVYEVKYREDLKQNWSLCRPKIKAAIHYCRTNGLTFRMVTDQELRTPFVQNATFLRRYRDYPIDEAIEDSLIHTMRVLRGEATPRILLLATYAYEPNRVKALAHLWKLMDAHSILYDSDAPLTMNSTIWLDETSEEGP